MKRKFGALMLSMLLMLTVVLSGCAQKQESKEAMASAVTNAMQMTSYEMKSSFVIEDLQIKMAATENSPEVEQVLTMLKNAELTLTGVHQAEPQQTEMQMGINLKGDMAMSFNIDMVMTQDKIYIKIPSIPFLPFPEDIVGKYLEMDLKELAEESGQTFSPDAMDVEKSQKFAAEVLNALIAEYDQAKYFKQIEAKDANLPEGLDVKQVVQFYITNDNVKEALDIFVNKSMPKIMDIAGKDEYRELLGMTKEEIEQAKKEISSLDQGQFKEGLEELQKYLKINTFNITTAIDKKDFPVYQELVMNVDFTDPETNDVVKLAIKGDTQYSKINEKQTFKIGIPKDADIVTIEQLEEAFYQMESY